MTNEYASNSVGDNPTITARDLGHDRTRADRRRADNSVETALMSSTTGTSPLARRQENSLAPAWVRLAARLRAPSLDNKLAQGVDPLTSEILSARVQQLAAVSMRHSLARGYLNLAEAAGAPHSPFTPVVPVARSRVLAAESLIGEVATALVGPLPRVRGIAMAAALLSDGAGPLFSLASDTDLSTALRDILAQLDPLASANL